MSAVSDRQTLAPDQATLIAALRTLHARLPVPQPGWHPHVALITDCRDDFGHAIDAAEEDPRALDLLAALIDGELEPHFVPDTPDELTEAWERLHALTLPEGQHPFLDEILAALDALRLLLIALNLKGA